MAAALSHDMRTPLSVINHGAELIGISNNLDTAKNYAQKISVNSKRLLEMVDELIDALTIDQGANLPLDLACFDMQALVQDIRDSMALPGYDIEMNGVPVTGYWCKESVRRAIENLTSNALRYGDGSTVTLNVAANAGRVMVIVHNSGKAIAPDRREDIFRYLHREAGAPGPGWGIGLPFVQLVAQSHGGSVALDSSAERGTTFIIDMPIDSRAAVEKLS